MFKIRKKLKHHPINLEESPMAQDVPQPPAEALTKRITIHADIPASLEVAGNIVMIFDKHLKTPHLIMPFDNIPLCLHLLKHNGWSCPSVEKVSHRGRAHKKTEVLSLTLLELL